MNEGRFGACYDSATMPFREVVGHEVWLRLLSGAVTRRTLPPSLLFSGPSGVGKRRVATALAQVLNCRSPATVGRDGVDGCGTCSSCRRIERGAHPDVLFVEPGESRSIGVDEIRHITGRAAYKPFEGRCRVVVINDADRLVWPAQNALLKTLEEPQTRSEFVLVTAFPDLLLATVRSRCQHLRFGHLSGADVAEVVRRISKTDSPKGQAAAALAGGSAGRALALMSGELLAAREAGIGFLECVARARDDRVRLEASKELLPKGRAAAAGMRQELTRRCEAVTSLLRDIELLSTGSNPAGLANPDVADTLRRLAPKFGGRRGVAAAAAVDQALDAVGSNVSPKVVADWLACQM